MISKKPNLVKENFFSFTQSKISGMNLINSKNIDASSMTPSPKKIFDEDSHFPDFEFSTTQSSCPTAATFSMSSKFSNANLLMPEISKTSSCKIKPIEIHKKKDICVEEGEVKKKNLAKSAKTFETNKCTEEINNIIHSHKKTKFREDNDKITNSINFINEFNLDSGVASEADLKALTNTQDIRDFHEYTKECIKDMKKVVMKDTSPNKVVLDSLHLKQILNGEKKLAVFDLDETLIHREVDNIADCDRVIEVRMPNKSIAKIGINIRPLLRESLEQIRKHYLLVLFTASQQIYADKVLELIDPQNEFFIKRLYRNSCKTGNIDKETIYIKDLDIFEGVPIGKTIIIDNSVLSFCTQLYNGIPILPYYDNKEDTELKDLVCYLDYLKNFEDIRPENKMIIGLNQYKDSSEFDSSSDEDEMVLVNEKECDTVYFTNSSVENSLIKGNYLSYNTNSSLSEISDYKSNEKQLEVERNQELFRCLEIYKKKYKKLQKKGSEKCS
jgi:Dullard-like phosphatase family protein